MRRLLMFLGFMLVGGGSLYMLGFLLTDSKPPQVFPSDEVLQEGITLLRFPQLENIDARGRKWRLQAERGILQEGFVHLEGVRFQLFDKGQSEAHTFGESGHAIWDEVGGRVSFSGKVRLEHVGKHWRAETESLEYEVNRGVLFSESAVRIESQQWVQQADGLQLFVEEGRVELENPLFYSR